MRPIVTMTASCRGLHCPYLFSVCAILFGMKRRGSWILWARSHPGYSETIPPLLVYARADSSSSDEEAAGAALGDTAQNPLEID